ncbi:DUF1540 domain-containing protein [Clostridium sp.]|uniref:DUF1540 domain-containing protein n=1 Tax=Clostridium sp. TaxID=1506 RepID=UPI0032172A32
MNGTLTCNANNCLHNISGLCSAKNIHIQGTNAHSSEYTQCSSFTEKGIRNAITNVFNMNVTGEVKQLFSSSNVAMNPRIQCDAANCRYNINGNCGADFIQIYGAVAISSNRTECETFQK